MKCGLDKNFMYYFIVGVVATLIDWLTFFILWNFFNIFYQFSFTVSFLLGSFIKFFLNKKLTFKDKSEKLGKQYFIYMIMVGLSYGISFILMWFFIDFLEINAFISRIITTFIVLFFGYFFDKNLTFNNDLIRFV